MAQPFSRLARRRLKLARAPEVASLIPSFTRIREGIYLISTTHDEDSVHFMAQAMTVEVAVYSCGLNVCEDGTGRLSKALQSATITTEFISRSRNPCGS